MHKRRAARTLFSALALGALAVTTASAQAADPQRADHALRRAVEVEQRMASAGATRAARLEAAGLHVESARLRSAADPQTVASLLAAARHVGDLDVGRTVRLLEEAAELAAATGDVERAAHVYLDAALFLNESRNVFTQAESRQLSSLHHRANLLSRSPLLGDHQRQRILQRLYPSVAF